MVDLDRLVCKELLWMMIERYDYDFVYSMMVEIGTDELPDYLEAIDELRQLREEDNE